MKTKRYIRGMICRSVQQLAGPSPRLIAWTAQLRKNSVAITSHWRHCVRFDRPGNRTQTSHTDSNVFTIELTVQRIDGRVNAKR